MANIQLYCASTKTYANKKSKQHSEWCYSHLAQKEAALYSSCYLIYNAHLCVSAKRLYDKMTLAYDLSRVCIVFNKWLTCDLAHITCYCSFNYTRGIVPKLKLHNTTNLYIVCTPTIVYASAMYSSSEKIPSMDCS